MSATISTNMIIPEVFSDYTVQEAFNNTMLYKSGLVVRNPLMDSFVGAGGSTFNVPFTNPLSGDDEAIQNNTSLTVNAISTGKQAAVRLVRGKAWGYEELAEVLSGTNIEDAITQKLTQYWDEAQQIAFTSIIEGVVADNIANDSGDLVEDITTSTPATILDANKINSTAVIAAHQKLGDKSGFDVIVMHSIQYSTLLNLNLISFVSVNAQDIGWGTYLGMTVFVCDQVPTETVSGDPVYWSILAKKGSFLYGESANSITPFEIGRDELKGEDRIITRRNYAIHPTGMKFTNSSVAGQTPTNTELKTVGNWDRQFNVKNMGFAILKTNG